MFADTITITINAVANVLTRVNQDKYSSEYVLRTTSYEYRLYIRNTSYLAKDRAGKTVDRHNVELTQTVYPVSPATASTIRKSYMVFEHDRGDATIEIDRQVIGFAAFFNTTNNNKLINGES